MRTALSVPALVLAFCSLVTAQLNRGGLAGTVYDPGGAGIPGARVVAQNIDTNAQVETITGSTGDFALPNVTPGSYTISAEAGGFKRATRNKIGVSVAEVVRVDMTLEIGSRHRYG